MITLIQSLQRNLNYLELDTANDDIIKKVKEIVHRYDGEAQVILFGSRARGDYEAESDWDFLILTEKQNIRELDKKLRDDIYDEIYFPDFEIDVQAIVRNKNDWEENHWVTGLYQSIKEDGKIV